MIEIHRDPLGRNRLLLRKLARPVRIGLHAGPHFDPPRDEPSDVPIVPAAQAIFEKRPVDMHSGIPA